MTVIDMETRKPTDRSVTFGERVITDFIQYCDNYGIAVCAQIIDEGGQQMFIGMHAYSEDMLGMLEVCQSKINRALMAIDDDDENNETLDGDS